LGKYFYDVIILHFLGKKIGAGKPYQNGAVLGSGQDKNSNFKM